MRKIKFKERHNGLKYCTFCKPAKVNAIYRNTNIHIHKKEEKICCACEEHKNLLVDGTAVTYNRPKNEAYDDHYTEADYDTWMRL